MDDMSDEVKELVLAVHHLVDMHSRRHSMTDEGWDNCMRYVEEKLNYVLHPESLKRKKEIRENMLAMNSIAGLPISEK